MELDYLCRPQVSAPLNGINKHGNAPCPLMTSFTLAPWRNDGVAGGRRLALVNYAASTAKPELVHGVPTVNVCMHGAPVGGFSEIWLSNDHGHSGQEGNILYSHDKEFLFCAGHIPLKDECTDIARQAYLNVFALTQQLGFPSIFRIWNFIPRINEGNVRGLEVYKDFCRGRAQAFEECYADTSVMPAATGIGSLGDSIVFYLLAARSAIVTHIENPRQVPAYRYPDHYGPKSPSFARATSVSLGKPGHTKQALFVSGTASIIGHETIYPDDVVKQCDVALANITHLISSENLRLHGLETGYSLKDLNQIKVYVRNKLDLLRVKRACIQAFHPDADIEYMIVDICRRDLLVEIEGIAPFTNRHRQ
jgi:chorismate lyase/3-hydroxybenzoate synthase